MDLLWRQPEDREKKNLTSPSNASFTLCLLHRLRWSSLFLGLTLRLIPTNPIVLLSTEEEVCEGKKKRKKDEQEFDKAGSIVLSWFGTIRLSVSKEPSDNKALLEKIFFFYPH